MIGRTTRHHDVPQQVTSLPGPQAAHWIARDDQVISPSYTRPYPMVIERGYGCMVEDVDGNAFLDFTAGLAVTSTGHSHPEVVAAIVDQASRFIHMSGTDFHYRAEIELAEKLAQITPGRSPKRVFFTNSGTETIEAAMKLARHHTGRERFLAFDGAFHGRTCGALSLNASKAIHREGFGTLIAGVEHLPYDCSRVEVEELFLHRMPPAEVAAIFVEPVQGEGGYRIPSSCFLPMLRDVCDENGILLVADEVQTGFGRTGKMFAVDHFGVEPDLLCLAKGIASGMPLGALVARAELMDWPPGSHASTFGGNPISCRAALATIDLIEREFLANSVRRGTQLQDGLNQLAKVNRRLRNVRGIGLMVAVDVVGAEGPDAATRDAIIQAAFQRGLLLVGCGKAAVRFCPALCVTEEQVTTALELFREAAEV